MTTAPITPRSDLPAPFIRETTGIKSFLRFPAWYAYLGGTAVDWHPVSAHTGEDKMGLRAAAFVTGCLNWLWFEGHGLAVTRMVGCGAEGFATHPLSLVKMGWVRGMALPLLVPTVARDTSLGFVIPESC